MKAKEWIALLKPLLADVRTHPDDEAKERQFNEQVAELGRECMQIMHTRLAGPEKTSQLNPDVVTRAFAEAEVKWNAVVHGVYNGGQEEEFFPLARGFLASFQVSNFMRKVREKKATRDQIRAMNTLVTAMSKTPTNQSSRTFQLFFNEWRAVTSTSLPENDFMRNIFETVFGFNATSR